MASGSELIVRITGKDTGLKATLHKAENDVEGFGSKIGGMGSKIGGALATGVAVGAGAAAVAVGGFFVKAISGASDMAETVSKVGVVFGDQAKQVSSFANQMAKDFGLPKREIMDAAASIGLIGKASGLSQGDAAKMSTQLAKMAADASSFYNVPLPEALQAIQSGLVGEAEPMRRFGVLLSAQAVDAEAARLGLTKVAGAYDEGAKAQARASLIMKGMSDASGDLERTQGSLSNRFREVKGRLENFATSVGTLAIPMVLKLFDGFEAGAARLGPVVTTIQTGFSAMAAAFSGEGITSDGFVGVMERIGVAAKAIVDWVVANWPQIQATISSVLDSVVAVVSGAVDIITTLWNNFGEQIVSYVQTAWDSASQIIKGAMDVIQGVIATVTAIIHGDWSAAWEGVKQVFAGVWQVINGLMDQAMNMMQTAMSVGMEIVGAAFRSAWDGIVGFVASIPGRLVDAIGDLGGLLFSAGADLIRGLINGIKSMASAAANAALDVVRGAVNAAKRFLGIGSPSKLFMGFGINVGEGMVKGLDRSHSMVATAAGNMAGATATGASTGTAGLGMPTSADPQAIAAAIAAALAPLLARAGMNINVSDKTDPMHVAREIAWAMG